MVSGERGEVGGERTGTSHTVALNLRVRCMHILRATSRGTARSRRGRTIKPDGKHPPIRVDPAVEGPRASRRPDVLRYGCGPITGPGQPRHSDRRRGGDDRFPIKHISIAPRVVDSVRLPTRDPCRDGSNRGSRAGCGRRSSVRPPKQPQANCPDKTSRDVTCARCPCRVESES